MSGESKAEFARARDCPACKRPRLFEMPGGLSHQHCFGCGQEVLPVPRQGPDAVAWGVLDASKQHLRDCLNAQSAWVHGLHPQVLVDAKVGIVPPDLDVGMICRPVVEAAVLARDQLLEAPRRPGRPSKKEQAAIEGAVALVDQLKNLQEKLTQFVAAHGGEVVCGFTGGGTALTRLVVPPGEGRTPDELVCGGGSGIFGQGMFPAGSVRPRSLEGLQERLIVPSEFDLMQLQSLGARLAQEEGLPAESGYFNAVAVGAYAIDAGMVRALGRMPLLIQNGGDPDQGRRMVEAIRQQLNLFTATVQRSTVADLMRAAVSDQSALQEIRELIRSQVFVARPFRCVGREMDDWRSQEGALHKFEVDREASRVLVRDLAERGQLFFDGRQAYVFEGQLKQVLPVDRDHLDTQLFMKRYGVAPKDSLFPYALDAIRLEAQERGPKATVYSLSHYDRETNRVYLFDQSRFVYRISKSKIERVDNGTDGVWFVRNPKWEPFEIGQPSGNRGLLVKALLGSLRLQERVLTRRELEMLFVYWVASILFPELFPTRPILAIIGPKGSGKTSILRRIGQMLFGPNFQVMGLSDEPKDFDAAVTGDAFVAVDNADADVRWLDDKLAVVATGGTLKRRLYYTTNHLVEFPITAFVGITSRTPHFRREDIADRLLLFNVDRLETFGAEGKLLAELAAQRNELMTELAGEVQRILRALDMTKGRTYASTFRIADFAEFVMRVEDSEGRLDHATQMFARLSDEQLAFVVQDDPVVEVLEQWLENRTNVGREVTTGQLFAELSHLAAQSGPPRSFEIKTVQKFGDYLQSHKATLKTLYGASDSTGRSRRRYWRFDPPEMIDAVESVEPVVNGDDEYDVAELWGEEIENYIDY